MKFTTYLALVGAVSAAKITKGTGMDDGNVPVARSSEDVQGQSLVQAQHGDSDDDEKVTTKPPVKDGTFVNETFQPELTMSRTYDHDMAQGSELRADAARMTVDITDKKIGAYCEEDQYVVGTWKKWNSTDGTKMEDVKESGDGRPAVFKIGHFQVSKCLDLAAQQMKHGETATITCPQDLDQGGDVQKEYRTQYSGDYWLQNSSATKYELSITECSLHPLYLAEPDDMESLVEGFPFYIKSGKKDKDGNEMCISADPKDQYAPRTTGVHNTYLSKCKPKTAPDTKQQWVWKADEQSLKSVGVPGGALFEGFNKNMIVYNWRGLHNQRFHYNLSTKKFQNRFTGNAMDVFGDKMIELENINTNEPDNSAGQTWIIDYQSASHGHDHEH